MPDTPRMSDKTAGHSHYVHGTSPCEQERLAALNRMTNAEFVGFLGVNPETRVLEVGSGLGLLAAEVAAAAEGVRVVALELSPDQIAAAVKSPHVRHVQGDARQLDFAEETFDLVYARYVLEHVPEPEKVLSEMRRVTKVGGRIALCENDVSLVRLDPPCPPFERVWLAFQRYQADLGGDARIGSRLYRLLRQAGCSEIQLSVQPEVHWHGSEGFAGWIQNMTDIVTGASEGLFARGLCVATDLERAVGELTELSRCRDASAHFVWNRALATR